MGSLDCYEIIEQIGNGTFGRVSKIKRKADNKVCQHICNCCTHQNYLKILVWKEMDYGKMGDKEKQQLVQEVNILQKLRHPHIVRYYDRIIDRENTTLYLVMEYCEGGDLASLIKKCRKSRFVCKRNCNAL
jgi:NIMA (never in mitosis gene a)-related kinase